MMKPGTVQVAVLPPVPVGDWTLPELSERIEEIRQQYVCVLATWPTTNEQLNLLLAGLAPAKGRPKTSLSSPGSRRQVHVALRGAQVGVPCQLLDGHGRCAPHREVRAERVPQDVDLALP